MHGTSAGAPVVLSGLGGLVTLADPETLPEGASPRTYDGDYDVGSWKTRAGLTSVYALSQESIGPNPAQVAVSTTWSNPDNILLSDGSYTTRSPVGSTGFNFLNISQFAFSIPSTSAITGVQVTVIGYSDLPANLSARLVINGLATFSTRVAALSQSPGTVTFGSLTDSWGVVLTPAILNATTFGVELTASSTTNPTTTARLDYATITVGLNTGTSNTQWVSTFVAQNGDVKNLSLDANGNFYVEDVTNAPGTRALTIEGITPGSYCVGINGPDVEYLSLIHI